jgi:hypothetical protein
MSETQSDARAPQLLAHALSHVGAAGGQCKNFVNDIVGDVYAGRRYLGGGYHSDFLTAGAQRVRRPRAGDVVQLNGPDRDRFYRGMHTAIVVRAHGPGEYEVVDSNFHFDECVRRHLWRPGLQARRWELDLCVWRFGEPRGRTCESPSLRRAWTHSTSLPRRCDGA